jgi:hypothetical protein
MIWTYDDCLGSMQAATSAMKQLDLTLLNVLIHDALLCTKTSDLTSRRNVAFGWIDLTLAYIANARPFERGP